MLPYLFIFSLVLIPALTQKYNKIKLFWFYLLILILIVFSGLRDMIGGYDVYVYAEVYEAGRNFILNSGNFEFGYNLFYLFLHEFSEDRHFMFMAASFIIIFFHAKAIKRYSPLTYFSFFIYFCKFFLMSFVYLRQGIAMAILWYALPLIKDKRFWLYMLVTLCAFNFHRSSLLFLPLYFISNIRFTNLQLVLMFIITTFISISPLSNFLITFIAESTELDKVAAYQANSLGFNPFYFLESIALFYGLLFFKNKLYAKPITTLIANGYLLYILVTILAVKNGAFIRFNWYFLIFVALGLTYFLEYNKMRAINNIFKIGILVYYTLLFFRLLSVWDNGDLVPYQTIFEPKQRKNAMWNKYEYRVQRKDYKLWEYH